MTPPPYRSVRFGITFPYPCRQWRVLSEDGTAYGVGVWKNGDWHPGSIFRALRECRGLRRQGEKQARVVWR